MRGYWVMTRQSLLRGGVFAAGGQAIFSFGLSYGGIEKGVEVVELLAEGAEFLGVAIYEFGGHGLRSGDDL